jgi:hypothetical protein
MQMEEQVIISSFEYNRLAFSKQIAPEIKTLWLLPDYLNQELIKKASEININILGVRPEDNVAKEMINASHIMNMNVWKWTVDDITEMRNFINLGIDGIITDNPQLLMSISRLQERNANLYMYVLNQNYPNPFNNETVITYYLSDKCFYRIVLYNVLGQQVRILREGVGEKGYYTINIDGKKLSSGDYYCILKINNIDVINDNLVKKITVLK